jgi:hypothetical protein
MSSQRVLAVVVVVGLVVGLLYLSGYLPSLGDAQNNMSVQFTNAQGDPIGPTLAFYGPEGQEAHGFSVTVSHQGTGSEYRLSTLYVDGLMEFYTVTYGRDGPYLDFIDSHSWVSRNPSGSESNIWYFGNWFDTTVSSSWTIRVVGHLEVTVEDAYGQAVDVEPWTDYVEFDVTWKLDTGSFSITGTIDYGFP